MISTSVTSSLLPPLATRTTLFHLLVCSSLPPTPHQLAFSLAIISNTCLPTLFPATIQEPKDPFQVRQRVTCTSEGTYCICCSQCSLLYIGEAKHRLDDQLCGAPTICSGHLVLSVVCHFNFPSHSHADPSIIGILLFYRSQTQIERTTSHILLG